MSSLEKCCARCKLPYPWCGKNRQCKCHLPAPIEKADPVDNVVPLFQEPGGVA